MQGGGAVYMSSNHTSEMGIGAGGLIKQAILIDPHPAGA